jgi:hypothetical protein
MHKRRFHPQTSMPRARRAVRPKIDGRAKKGKKAKI